VIAEAVDTVLTLGAAFVVWIVLLAATATLALWTVLVTVVWACRGLWRGVTAVRSTVQRPTVPELLPAPHEPSRARTAPSWANARPTKEN
jgi:hypothetical protein